MIPLLVLAGRLFKSEFVNHNEQVQSKSRLRLESFYNDRSEYDAAFQKASNNTDEKVLAGIISHHFLAKDLIAQFFSGIDSENIKNIYIIGPDHYESLSGEKIDLVTSTLDWDTPYNVFYSNQTVINNLVDQLNIKTKDTIFKNEHSIYTLVPFAKKIFPNAKIIPLVLKNSDDYQKFYNYGKQTYREDSLLIVSADFSHQATKDIAYENDINSIKSLVSSDLNSVDSIESDCNQCIAFLYGYISHKPSRFKLVNNRISSDFGGQEEENLTSYISAYYIPDNIRLLFGGDVMLDRYIRQVATKYSYDYVFQEITASLLDKDLVLVNLEGPITSYKSISLGTKIGSKNNYLFTFDKEILNTLTNQNIKLVNIGNNHILDFGHNGLNDTIHYLSKNTDIAYFGNLGFRNTNFSTELKGKKIAFVNYNQFVSEGFEKTIDEIKKTRVNNDLVIVYAHWGNEYTRTAAKQQRESAHNFIDAGADAIIGSHPHVIQEAETYKGKKIYYSLGNLIFDQYFLEDTQKGLLVEMIIDLGSNEISFENHYVTLQQNGQTTLAK